MNWGSIGNFFHMGGYGPYVWGSYGMCFGLIALEMLSLRARRRSAVVEVWQAINRQEQGRQRQAGQTQEKA
jgi:heme exporter protein D